MRTRILKIPLLNSYGTAFKSFIKGLTPPFLYNFLYLHIIVGKIPSAKMYKPHYQPWRELRFKKKYNAHTASNLEKLYILEYYAISTCKLKGDIAEAGVWRGGSAKFILDSIDHLTAVKKKFYLFDSFEGMKIIDKNVDKHKIKDFSDTNIDFVNKLLLSTKPKNIMPIIKAGWIPHTFINLKNSYSFVHIDLDLYESIKDSLNFFYKRLVKGGVIVLDDYGYGSCPGAKKAVDSFCKNNNIHLLVFSTGQAVINKTTY
jgi:O-methyltransferase